MSRRLPLLDAVVFSCVWLGAAAGCLTAAAAVGLGVAIDPRAVGLAFTGTLVIYNVDRLRDLDRDRLTSPARSNFVVCHERALRGLTTAAAVVALALATAAGARIALLLAPVLAAGLAHRRLKRFAFAKHAYITVGWLLVVVGIPWVLDPAVRGADWVVAALGSALLANAIASNVRDREAGAARLGPERALAVARVVAVDPEHVEHDGARRRVVVEGLRGEATQLFVGPRVIRAARREPVAAHDLDPRRLVDQRL